MKQKTKANLMTILLIIIAVLSLVAVFFLVKSAKITGEMILDNETIEDFNFSDMSEGDSVRLPDGRLLVLIKKNFEISPGKTFVDDVNITTIE